MIEILLVLIFLALVAIARGLWTINENIRHHIRVTQTANSEQVLLGRGNNVRLDESTELLKMLVRYNGMKV